MGFHSTISSPSRITFHLNYCGLANDTTITAVLNGSMDVGQIEHAENHFDFGGILGV